jgi:phosphatidylglycerol---prolipoprotein diacylglyceryl transferase
MWPMLGPVKSYAPIYLLGIVLHLLLALLWARKLRVRWYLALGVNACYLFGMIVGSKILHDIQKGALSWANLCSVAHWQQGGMWGGPLAYFAAAVPLALLLGRDRRTAVDLVALATPIPMLVAKIACLCNGCCHGQPTNLPWAMTFPANNGAGPAGVPVHPTQIYEMLVLVVTWAVLRWVNRPSWRGTLLLWFLAVYGVGRASTEFFRGDIKPEGSLGPLTYSQWLCLAASAVSVLSLLIYSRRSQPRLAPV